MLATKTLLKDGRYCIDKTLSSGPDAAIYLATDNIRRASVIIIERQSADGANDSMDNASLARIQHEGLVRINDDFEEKGCSYCATEPLAPDHGKMSLPDGPRVDTMFEQLGSILLAINTIRSETNSFEHIDLSERTVLETADGRFKFLYTGTNDLSSSDDRLSSPFLALERIWDDLDHITQKAIYNGCDEDSLALLESAPDVRTDLYSLGAVFYRLLTATDPIPALERVIESLDSKPDPVQQPSTLNTFVNDERSAFVMRMMAVKRERRFVTIEDAIFNLPAQAHPAPLPQIDLDDLEDMALLEIPAVPVSLPSPASMNGHGTAVADIVIERAPAVKDAAPPPEPAKVDVKPFIPAVKEPVAAPPTEVVQTVVDAPDISAGLFSSMETASDAPQRNLMKPLALAAAALVALGAGFGIYTYSSSASQTNASAPRTTVESPRTEQAALPTPEPVRPSTETQASTTEPATAETDPATAAQTKARPQIADVKARPQDAKPKAETKPKKKLTVDDLINDN